MRAAGRQELPYQNPGKLFIERFGVPRGLDDVVGYADFLRQEAGMGDEPPIDLTRIFGRFGIRSHKVPLVDQQGVSDGLMGTVLIKEDDPEVRQRFSEAHELMEFLFHQYKLLPEWEESDYASDRMRKEKLCQKGAAALLMPQSSFGPAMGERGFSFRGASELAHVYETSLLATVCRMLDGYEDERLLVIWRWALKPREVEQLGRPGAARPQRRLRIWWAVASAGASGVFIPVHQSAAADSIVARCFESGQGLSGRERLGLKGIDGRFWIEAKRVNLGGEVCVLSLLRRGGE